MSNKSIKIAKSVIFTIMLFATPFYGEGSYIERVTKEDLISKYENSVPIKVLIVPGHDGEFSGAAFSGVKEVYLNRILAEDLYKEFKSDPKFLPTITQVNNDYIPELQEYFENNWKEIENWRRLKAKEMRKLEKKGRIEPFEGVAHAVATTTVIQRLYGINKWASEKDFDIILHVHFNDYGSRNRSKVGEYGGFSIYIPESEMFNAEAAPDLSQGIYNRLNRLILPSNFPSEANFNGPIPGRELIAIGANNTLTAPSILIEYSYIYEGLAGGAYNQGFFKEIAEILAEETYEGIRDFFRDNGVEEAYALGNEIHNWNKNLGREKDLNKVNVSKDVLFLQMVLRRDGVYPVMGKNTLDCPITGKFGECTELALKEYQQKYNINPVSGFLGPKTREFLNQVYGK